MHLSSMDRPVDPSVRNRRRIRRSVPFVLVPVGLLLVTLLAAARLRPTVDRADIRTGRVERGLVESTVPASGRVVPAHEQVLVSPLDTRVLEVLHQPGDSVTTGDAIVSLDERALRLAIEKIEDQIALQQNQRRQAEVEIAGTRQQLLGQSEVEAVELRAAEQEAERSRKLFEMGLITKAALEQKEIALERKRVQVRQLHESVAQAEANHEVRLDGLDLQIALFQKDRQREEQRLEQGRAAPDRSGVVTWVISGIGNAVREGEVLARVSDLRSYRVEATISDVHAASLVAGQRARVRVGDDYLPARVSHVRPAVENGAIALQIELDQPEHPGLRQNLRVDVHVVVDQKENVLSMPRGSIGFVDGHETIFAIHGERAVRTRVDTGLTGFERVEVLEGLAEGDEVILSDMSDHQSVKEVRLRGAAR